MKRWACFWWAQSNYLVLNSVAFLFKIIQSYQKFSGALPQRTPRSLKRCNSETDLMAVLPAGTQTVKYEPNASLSKQLSSISSHLLPLGRLRKSIKRRSWQKSDQKLTPIREGNLTSRSHPKTESKSVRKFSSIPEVREYFTSAVRFVEILVHLI